MLLELTILLPHNNTVGDKQCCEVTNQIYFITLLKTFLVSIFYKVDFYTLRVTK